MQHPLGAVAAFLILPLTGACSGPSADRKRQEAFRRAAIWSESRIEEVDIRRGPSGPGALSFEATITCDYVNRPLRGHSQKFACDAGGDLLRVKFGKDNGEVFGEVAATRLLWALGFGADRMYPARVICRRCPEKFEGTAVPEGRLFDPAVVERPMAGAEFEDEEGWSWSELDDIDERAGGAPRAHRDALKLLAAFLQHTDNKTEQQRLLCIDEPQLKHPRHCARPFLMLDDVGLTFGVANLANSNALGSVNLDAWKRTPVWSYLPGCVGNLSPSFTGSTSYPRVSEEGRQFLTALLGRLSNAQIHDLFAVARFDKRGPESRGHPAATIDEWVRVFEDKRRSIASRHCD